MILQETWFPTVRFLLVQIIDSLFPPNELHCNVSKIRGLFSREQYFVISFDLVKIGGINTKYYIFVSQHEIFTENGPKTPSLFVTRSKLHTPQKKTSLQICYRTILKWYSMYEGINANAEIQLGIKCNTATSLALMK